MTVLLSGQAYFHPVNGGFVFFHTHLSRLAVSGLSGDLRDLLLRGMALSGCSGTPLSVGLASSTRL